MVQGAADEEAHAETGAERVRGAADEEAPAETGAEMVQHAAGEDVRGGRQRGLACVPTRCCEQKRTTRYRGPNTVRPRNGDQLCDWFPPVREFPTVDDSRGSRCSIPTWVQCMHSHAGSAGADGAAYPRGFSAFARGTGGAHGAAYPRGSSAFARGPGGADGAAYPRGFSAFERGPGGAHGAAHARGSR